MNKVKLSEIVSRYKSNFNEVRPKELYKWEAVKCFQDNWDDQAEDFKSMLRKSLSKQTNILTQYEVMGLNRLAADYPNELRSIFLQLFNDDGATIIERTERYLTAVTSLSKTTKGDVIKHNQTERAVSVYLFLMKPEENYIYNRVGKFERFAKLIDYTNYPSNTGLDKLKSYYEMCDKIREYIIEDQELLSMSANSISSPEGIYYQDVNYRLLTDDIVFVSSWISDEKDWWPPNEYYHPGIDKDKWIELWSDSTIFNDISKEVISCFLAFEDGATCTQVSKVYGKNGNYYNGTSKALADRIVKAGVCNYCKDGEKERFFPILYTGKRAGSDVDGDYMWKLRPELREALEELGVEPPSKIEISDIKYWLGGASYGTPSKIDVSQEFINAGVYAVDFEKNDISVFVKNTEEFNSWVDNLSHNAAEKAFKSMGLMSAGDRIAIKSSFAKTMPNKQKSVSTLRIKAIGTILKSLKDGYVFNESLGHTIPVRWDVVDVNIDYEIGYYRDTIHQVEKPEDIELIFFSGRQNLEKEFVAWFQTQTNKGKPYKDNYLYAIQKTLRAICKALPDIDLQEPNLFYQTDLETFRKLQTTIRNSKFYDSVNKKTGSGVFSAGMDHYERFLEVRAGISDIEDIESNEDDEVGYYSEIIRAFKELDGKALWRDLCDNIEERGVLPAIYTSLTWKQTVSSYLQFKCSDSPQYKGKEDLFSWDKATKIWGLRDYDTDVLDEPETFPIRSPRQSPKHQMNVILYGAPGTGKTYSVTEYAVAIYEDRDVRSEVLSEDEREALLSTYKGLVSTGHVVFTTFHQSYGYEDFIQGLRPVPNSETLKFNVEDGVFKNISDRAMNDDDNNYVIIIDEINRANISKVFGELITLIESDKRWGEANELSITLPSGSPFAIPNNLYIIGTMNSADKSISLIDTALRRRFDFIEIAPNATLIENRTLRKVLKALNKELLSELDSSDFLIGHAYFINKTEADLVNIMNRNIIPLLYEYFHDNEKKVKAVVSKAIEEFEYGIDENENRIGRLKIV